MIVSKSNQLTSLPCCLLQSRVIPCLLRLRNSHNAAVAESAREALALVGYVDAVSGRGIRVLSLDGGGTKYASVTSSSYQFIRLRMCL